MAVASILALAQIAPGQAAAVCGLPGSGKTRDTQLASKAWRRSVVFDPYAERDRLNDAAGGHDTHPWPGRLVSVRTLCEHPELMDGADFRLVVAPVAWKVGKRIAGSLDAAALGAQFSLLAELCWATGGGIVLVAEEAGLYSRACADLGLRIATGGRHGGLSMVALSQAIGRIHIDYRRTMSLLCTGCQNEPADVDSIRDRCGDAFARKVAALPRGAPLLVWRSGAPETSPAVAVPRQGKRGKAT